MAQAHPDRPSDLSTLSPPPDAHHVERAVSWTCVVAALWVDIAPAVRSRGARRRWVEWRRGRARVRPSSALVRLSRDHHESLVAAQRLRRATTATAGDARTVFLAFWDRAGVRHFGVEEEVLLPAFARWGDADDPLVARTLCDHVAIRASIAALRVSASPSLGDLVALGERLAEHVRMEERELFGLIERAIPPADLDLLADRVARAERG